MDRYPAYERHSAFAHLVDELQERPASKLDLILPSLENTSHWLREKREREAAPAAASPSQIVLTADAMVALVAALRPAAPAAPPIAAGPPQPDLYVASAAEIIRCAELARAGTGHPTTAPDINVDCDTPSADPATFARQMAAAAEKGRVRR